MTCTSTCNLHFSNCLFECYFQYTAGSQTVCWTNLVQHANAIFNTFLRGNSIKFFVKCSIFWSNLTLSEGTPLSEEIDPKWGRFCLSPLYFGQNIDNYGMFLDLDTNSTLFEINLKFEHLWRLFYWRKSQYKYQHFNVLV